jgi:hypothetical protein
MHVIISHTHKLIYLYIPKCACTTLKSLIVNLEPDYKLKIKGTETNDQLDGIFKPYITKLDYCDLEKYQDYTIFTCIRDPIKRLLSCYNDKIVTKFYQPFNKFGLEKNMDFDQFIQTISALPHNKCDGHFRSQSHFLYSGKNFIPHYVLRLEDLEEDVGKLMKQVGVEKYDLFNFRSTKHNIVVSETTKTIIQDRYYQDFDLIKDQ